MNLLREYIEWVRKHIKRDEETPVVVEPQQVQPVITVKEKPVRKPRAPRKKINMGKV